jgi:DNA-binding beta-propeller fold protein YncE
MNQNSLGNTATPHCPGRKVLMVLAALAAVAGVCALAGLGGPSAQLQAATPAAGGAPGAVTVFDAAKAAAVGKWTSQPNPLVAGGTYMSAGAEGVGTSLEFPIEVDKPTEIAVKPLWFSHGDQRKARRFPDTLPFFNVQQDWPIQGAWYDYNAPLTMPAPVVSKPGPDAIDVLGDHAYFTAPAGGKIGVVDLQTQKVVGSFDVGGYASDLVADKDRNELLVADAAHNLIVVFDAKDGKKLAEIPVPALPWSIALYQGKLFVASMAAKRIAVVDVAARKVTGGFDLPVGPQNVAVTAGANPQLIVRLLPMVTDARTLKEVPADRLTYWPWNIFGAEFIEGEKEALDKAIVAYPKAKLKTFFCGRRPTALVLDSGPSLARYRARYPNPVPASKLFLVEPDSKAITVVPADGGKVTQIALDETPTAMSLYDLRLYVLCKQAKKVLLVDVTNDKVVDTVNLPYVADEFFVGCLAPKTTSDEYITSSPVMEHAIPGRIAVGFHPLAFDPQTLALAAAPDRPFLPLDRHNKVSPQGGKIKQLAVDNLHTIQVDDNPTAPAKPAGPPTPRWIDTSCVTDFHVTGNPALLMPGDEPGAVTLRVDNGPEYDWENDVWFTPDYRMMLVRGTDEFDLWNGVRFTLAPGKHVLKVTARSRYANLEGIQVKRTLAGALDVRFQPLPEKAHGGAEAAVPSYGGTFGADEPMWFNVKITNKSDHPQDLRCEWTMKNYAGATASSGNYAFTVAAGATVVQPMKSDLKEPGRYTIRMKISSPDGEHEVYHRFVKLPKLDYPRLIARAEDTPQIQDRLKKYATLFGRYREYLRRQSEKADFVPKVIRGSWGQEMWKEYPKWHALCLAFADAYLEAADARKYQAKLVPLVGEPGGYDAWQGNYEFGDAHTILSDLMMSGSDEAKKNRDKFYGEPNNGALNSQQVGGTNLPDYLMSIKDPLTEQNRAVLYRAAMEMNNYDGYFGAHAGSRGGNWWHGTSAMCHCPVHSMTRTFLWWRNFFGEKDFFERTSIRGMLTLQSYAYPRFDTHTYWDRSAFRETWDTTKNTEAMRWALSGLSRQPLEKTYYKEVFDCIDKLSGPMTDEAKEVDELLSKGCNVVIPMYLALGWVDPDLKAVQWEEMPPSMIFDPEGAVCMKSGWDKNMTDIYFVSGIKDMSYRAIPNHFQIFKAGEMIAGMARVGDHGCPVPLYGNSVRVGEEERPFKGYLTTGWNYERMDERFVTDCFSTLGYTYMFRDWRLSGYREEGTNWDGGGHGHSYPREVVMHSHTSHPFFSEGKILAYETSPEFDYVVGDATNSWALDDVEEAYRQVLFVRPDVIIMYDRLALGDPPKSVKWPMMTVLNTANKAGNPTLTDNVFSSANGVASVWGKALLPKGGKIKATTCGIEGLPPNAVGYIEIQPPKKSRRAEFLVAMRVGLAQAQPLDCKLVETAGQAGIAFTYDSKSYTVLFNREGAVGGHIKIEENGETTTDRDLTQQVRDTYENWKGTGLFDKWMHEDRFKTYVTPEDRKRFGADK